MSFLYKTNGEAQIADTLVSLLEVCSHCSAGTKNHRSGLHLLSKHVPYTYVILKVSVHLALIFYRNIIAIISQSVSVSVGVSCVRVRLRQLFI
jgi:hypothetical protein